MNNKVAVSTTDTYRALGLIAAKEGCRLVDVVRAAIAQKSKYASK